MSSTRTIVTAVAGIALASLTVACNKPNLESTGGGYEELATSSAEADTGRIAPHEGPAPVDTVGEGTDEAIEH